jgi:hypothetical protein
MYILPDYRLILTKDRPDLSSERALQNYKPATVQIKFQGERKFDRGSQMGA